MLKQQSEYAVFGVHVLILANFERQCDHGIPEVNMYKKDGQLARTHN